MVDPWEGLEKPKHSSSSCLPGALPSPACTARAVGSLLALGCATTPSRPEGTWEGQMLLWEGQMLSWELQMLSWAMPLPRDALPVSHLPLHC